MKIVAVIAISGINFFRPSDIYFPIWVKLGVRDLDIILLSTGIFLENDLGEGYTFLTGINEVCSVLVKALSYVAE